MHLQENDLVALVSPAGYLSDEKAIVQAQNLLKKWHLRSYVDENAMKKSGHFAGTDEQRLAGLQAALDNPEVKMIWALRGGYGAIRIVDELDFSNFVKQPKLVTGFSDITILHAKIQQLGFPSLHAFMPVQLKKKINKEVARQTKNVIKGRALNYNFQTSKHTADFQQVEGTVVGGNLANLYSLLGTNLSLNTTEKILFIEDVGEQLYQIDRMIIGMKKAGKLKNLKALLVGQFTEIPENNPSFEKTYKEIILEHTAGYDYPVIFDAPIGHITNNYPLILGHKLTLKKGENQVKMYQKGLGE